MNQLQGSFYYQPKQCTLNYKEIPPKKYPYICNFWDPPKHGSFTDPWTTQGGRDYLPPEYQLPQVSPFPLVLQTLVHWSSPSNPSIWMQIGRRDAPQGVVGPENPWDLKRGWLIRIEVKKMPIHGPSLWKPHDAEKPNFCFLTQRSPWLYLENAWKQC